MKKRILSILLAITLLIGCIPQLSLTADASQESITVQDPLRYGWRALMQMDNADDLLFAYEKLVEGLAECRDCISVYDDTHSVTTTELSTVMEAVHSDYPEFFWLGLGYSMSTLSGSVRSVTPKYTMTASQVKTAKAALEAKAAVLLTGLEGKSDYEISKLLHDRLAAYMTYQSTDNDQTIYGALVEQQAVCAGYAAAYQYLLQQAGIPAWKVSGSSIDPTDGTPKTHAWTLVCLDGSWYHTDLTWDDQGNLGNIYYAYFNVTSQQILQDHALNTFYANALPTCSATSANYFVRNSNQLQTFNVDRVVETLRSNNLQGRFFVTGDRNTFLQAFTDNIYTIMSRLGLSGSINYGYKSLGRELDLFIRTGSYVPFPVGITLTSLPYDLSCEGSLDVSGGAIKVHYNDGSAKTLAMNSSHISGFDGTTAGTQVLTVTAEGQREYFTVRNSLPQPVKVPGDMDGDTIVTNSDVIALMWHTLFPDTNPIQGDGDVTGDSTITNDDVVKLLWYVLFPVDNPL